MRKSLRRIFWLIFLMFALIIFHLIKLATIERHAISTNPYNPRLNYSDPTIKRGSIKDINGDVIAVSKKEGDSYQRTYPRSRMVAHITGYSGKGKNGIEAAENFELETVHNQIYQRLSHAFFGTEVQGNSVVLSVDMDIQSVAGDLLGDQNGAIVAMEPSTGRVIAMQAYPDYDPNMVAQNWEELNSDTESPLLNRASQGLYPPGSTFKVVTALAAMETLTDWKTFTYECAGEANFDGKIIHCFNNTVHGTVDMEEALAQSCNCYFSEIGKRMGAEKLREVAQRLYFGKNLDFVMPNSVSTVALNKNSGESEIVETAIGQGKTLATPLYMACLASAIANGGILKKPYILDHVEYYNEKKAKTTIPETLDTIMTVEEAQALKKMMAGVVEFGTGTAAQVSGYTVAGKTGTAENSSGSDHSWFIGFAPAENPTVAVAVLLENAQGGRRAAPIAGKVIQAVLKKQNNS